jgi:prolyl-tRNA editing enzyme YbaK/EbsC (Cys-tRNA(Pro) deacylase)
MNELLGHSAQNFQKKLFELGYKNLQVIEMPDTTRTAIDAARAVGCEVGQIVKSLVFKTKDTHKPVLVETSGSNRVNEKIITELVGETIVKADADYVRQKTGYAIGGVPPTGHLEEMMTFVDEDLTCYQEIWAAAGSPNAVFKLTPQDLLFITQGKVAAIKTI